MKIIPLLLALLISSFSFSQSRTKRVLFLGNSYTSVNNLPQMTADIAASMGDTIIFDMNAPGGHTLQQHSTNPESLYKIASGNWDNVVLQEQSQLPSFSNNEVEAYVFPYAHILDSIINSRNPCAETMFYMTWGRKNGDDSNCSAWPPVCTYGGMDSLLNLRYRMMAERNAAILSPVGAVWNYIRKNFPAIDLYQSDDSHPSSAGTYAAACSFYTAIFKKDPAHITFNSILPAATAQNIRIAARRIVYDSMPAWYIGEYDPVANYTYSESDTNQISFTNSSINATSFSWNFGDNQTSTSNNPTHQYSTAGSYIVTMIATQCAVHDTLTQTIILPGNQNTWAIYPNPATAWLILKQNLRGNLSYRIFNLAGSEIQSGPVYSLVNNINISACSNGLYFLELFNNARSIGVQKFIKMP